MTTQDNTIEIESKNKSLVFYHLNRLIIIGLSTIALAFDGYQTPDIFYGVSIVIWLWLPEIEIIERKTVSIVKQLSIILLTAFMVIALYMILGAFVQIIQWFPNYEIWILFTVVIMGIISLFYKTIIWLAINNPVQNIGKEYRNEGAIK